MVDLSVKIGDVTLQNPIMRAHANLSNACIKIGANGNLMRFYVSILSADGLARFDVHIQANDRRHQRHYN